jgi:general secretion pathway protein M
MQISLATMSERERRMVLIGAVVGALILLLGVILPLDHSVNAARTRVDQKQRDLVWMRNVAPVLRASAPAAAPANGESLLVVVDRSARESGLGSALAGSEPSGPGGLRVRLEKAPFDAIVGWLARLAQQNGIRVDGATVDSAGAPGLVNASVILQSH